MRAERLSIYKLGLDIPSILGETTPSESLLNLRDEIPGGR